MLKKGVPRHIQITEWLRKQIEEGIFSPDEKLPSENELAKKFDVSRVTIRRALQSLENESEIYRCQGLGSFVSDSRVEHNLIRLTDFNEDMTRAGLEASSLVKEFQIIKAPAWLTNRLKIEEGQKVIQIDRLRLGNHEPVAFDSTWLPVLYGQLLNPDELTHTTIYNILEDQYDIPVIRGCYRISAESAETRIAKELKVEDKTALLLIDRLSFTIGDKPLYYQKRYYRSDKVTYEMILERNSGNERDMPLKEFAPVFTPADATDRK